MARASIWRMRSRVRPKLGGHFREAMRFATTVESEARVQDRALPLVEHGQTLANFTGKQRGRGRA